MEKVKYYLARYSKNFADEFYVSGMKIFIESEYEILKQYQEKLKILEQEGKFDIAKYGVPFGTNEDLTFKSVDEAINAIDVREIIKEEYEIFSKFDLLSFGNDALFDFFENTYEDISRL